MSTPIDNLTVTAGKKDETKVYLKTPKNYDQAKAAIKEAGGVWKISSWELDKAAYAAAEPKIRAAMEAENAMTPEARAERAANAPKRERADQGTPEEREAKRAAWELAKAHRVVVKAGTLNVDADGAVVPGQEIVTPNGSKEITSLGKSFEVDARGIERLKKDHPEADIAVGDTIAYAYYAPDVAAAPDMQNDPTAS